MKKVGLLLFLITSCFSVFGQNSLQKRVNFSVKNEAIPVTLERLSQEANIGLTFSSNFFEKRQKISLSVKNESVGNILKRILSQTEIDFKLIDNQIVLFKKPPRILKNYTISGYLEDAETGERLISANIYSKPHSKGTVSNEYGFFSLTLPEGSLDLNVSYLGYTEFSEKLNLTQNLSRNIALEPSVTLTEIIVTPNDSLPLTKALSGKEKISMPHAQSMPDLGGESDIIRMVQLLPGVQSGADGFGGLYVRGGSVDQNLMMVDGVPIYNPMHLLGIFSIYNTDAVRSAVFFKGGFPARYGSRSSSVFDVRTKEGNQRKFGGEAGIGLVTGKLRLELPILNKNGSILVAARSNVTDFLTRPFTEKLLALDDTYERSDFVDFNAKINYSFSQRDKIFLSFYSGGDEIRAAEDDLGFFMSEDEFVELYELEGQMAWGNKIGALRWNHLFNQKLFANTTLTYSNYSFENRTLREYSIIDFGQLEWEDRFEYLSFGSDLTDWTAKTDFDFIPSHKHHVKFGAGFIFHRFLSGPTLFDELEDFEGENFDSLTLEQLAQFENLTEHYGSEYYGYIEDEIEISDKWRANIGLRLSGFFNENNHWVNLEPRINSTYALSENVNMTASYSEMTQYLHLISFTGFGLPSDIWAMSEGDMPPQKTRQTTFGLNFELPRQIDFGIEAYYKTMKNLVHLPSDYDLADDDTQFEEVELYKGNGWGYGLEFMLKRKFGKTGGWLSYAISKSERQFDELNLGKRYPFHQDRRHVLNLALYHRLTKHIELGANFVYGSKNPYVLVEGDLIFGELLPQNSEVNPPGERNNRRQSAYHRLDLGIKFNYEQKRLRHQLKLGVYNLYNRENVAYNQMPDELFFPEEEVSPVSVLGIRPSFSYSVKF